MPTSFEHFQCGQFNNIYYIICYLYILYICYVLTEARRMFQLLLWITVWCSVVFIFIFLNFWMLKKLLKKVLVHGLENCYC